MNYDTSGARPLSLEGTAAKSEACSRGYYSRSLVHNSITSYGLDCFALAENFPEKSLNKKPTNLRKEKWGGRNEEIGSNELLLFIGVLAVGWCRYYLQ
jgi:hypothetical protein